MRTLITTLALTICLTAAAATTGTWRSTATGRNLKYTAQGATANAAKGADKRPMTVVYLENLRTPRVSTVSNADNVAWLRSQGYQVIEIDYEGDERAVAPALCDDIMDINESLMGGTFCGQQCSNSRSYVLMEGFRLQRDIAYYTDDPTIYNYPDAYAKTAGDPLYLDLVYPASPAESVPVVVTFSYSTSHANQQQQQMRMNLINFWGKFRDSFVEGASALGFAWAVCDHPKYCDWGNGKYTGGGNKSLGAIEVNPDARRKVRSAIRTVRAVGRPLGLNGDVAVSGFSRGSTAAALAVGDGDGGDMKPEEDTRGRHYDEDCHVQCALLGPGIFDPEHAVSSSNEYSRTRAYIAANGATSWAEQGALCTIETSASAPTLFYYNSDDYYKDDNQNPDGRYGAQAARMKARLDAVGTPTAILSDYSTLHAVPQRQEQLQGMYDFLTTHVTSAPTTAIRTVAAGSTTPAAAHACDLMGRRVGPGYRGLVVRQGRLVIIR